jgi:GT2 family glycosyltransferase
MKVSILIVTKNRKIELDHTLRVLERYIDKSIHEVLVFDDASTDNTADLIAVFDWVIWEHSNKGLGASLARNRLYKKAKGDIFIGFDDDAHPLSEEFISITESVFFKNPNVGIIAFQEIKGIYESDNEALEHSDINGQSYITNDFVGCGFAIRKEVYDKTNGFPVWIDIYGEESCLAIEVLDLGYEIHYDNTIIVNHRIDRKKRLRQGRNYFRFEKQLKNTIYYYVVYYPNPMLKIARLLFHNFKKYALKDHHYFRLFWKSIFIVFKELFQVLKFRKPVQKSTLQKLKMVKGIKY